jgi:hypothetical protein
MEIMEKYMQWIKEFSKGAYGFCAGNTLGGFQPLDFWHFLPMWYDLWIKRIAEAIDVLDLENKQYSEIKDILPDVSSMRGILIKIITTHKGVVNKDSKDFKKVSNFLAQMLIEACPLDPFAKKSNPIHSQLEIQKEIDSLNLKSANPEVAREIGKLITVIASLLHGLYGDITVDFGWDTYGPYQLKYQKENYTLLIRHFKNLQPQELWPKKYLALMKDIKIYTLYQNVEWEIVSLGCHTILKKGSAVQNLKNYLILIDGQEVDIEILQKIITDFANKAESIYKDIRKMNLEEIKDKALRQESYQFKKLFETANLDWQPTAEMVARVKNKCLLKNIFPYGKMISNVEEFNEVFGINEFAKNVLGEKS